MSENGRSRAASLGNLPFTLRAEELRARGAESLRQESERFHALLSESVPATVESFLAPLDRVLVSVHDIGAHGGLLFQVHPEAEVRAVGRELSESADRFFNEFRVNDRAYRKILAVDLSSEDAETRFVVGRLLRDMRRFGAERSVEERDALVALASRLDSDANEFNGNIAASPRGVSIGGPDPLRGLPADFRAAHTPGADGQVRVSTKYPDLYPVMNYADDPELRRRLLLEAMNVAFPANIPVLLHLLSGRREFALRLGFTDYAELVLEDKMAKRPENVVGFLDRVALLLGGAAAREQARLLARKRKDRPDAAQLEDWDGRLGVGAYYLTKVREEEYGVDLRRFREYLPFPAVRDGLFELCRELFGLEFRRNASETPWHASVEVYDVERGGVPFGRCYFDFVPRVGKYSHAAQFDVRTGLRDGGLPQGALICNFLNESVPTAEARMDYRDVVTFFHEFGHLVHHLFSGHGRWFYGTMSALEWDFIEGPSQLFEEWARDPATLARFARNPETGEPIPNVLLERLRESEAVGRASYLLRQVALADVSLRLHVADPHGLDPPQLFAGVFEGRLGYPFNPEYHWVASFGHLTGYSAIYYTYLWSAVIARDLLTPFQAMGSLTDRGVAERYAAEVLAPGGSRPAAELIRRFLGRDYSFDAFERWALAADRPFGADGAGAKGDPRG